MTTKRLGLFADLTYHLRQVASSSAIGCVALCMHSVAAATAADPEAAGPPAINNPESDEDPRYGHIEDVVVTAEKRPESQQDVPLSIAALSSDQLQRLNITDFGDL